MPRLVKSWLASFDWEIVTEINRGLCQHKNALHKPTPDGNLPAKTLWQTNQSKDISLVDALESSPKIEPSVLRVAGGAERRQEH